MRNFKIVCGLTLAGVATFGQNITTVAGSYTGSNIADGGPAISTKIPGVSGIVYDQAGNLYIWDNQSSKVKIVDTSGNLHTVAGNGVAGFGGDNGSALNAELEGSSGNLNGLAMDAAGNLYLSDSFNNVVRKVDKSGNITTFAGTYYSAASNPLGQFGGDQGPATQAQLSFPAGIAFDNAGNLYIADSGNNRIRKVDTSGMISTVAGNGHVVYEGDGVQAMNTAVPSPQGVTVDGQGNLYIASTTLVRRVDTNGIITTYAGTPPKKSGYSGDGGQANAALLKSPSGLVADNLGNLFIADADHVRKVDATGTITTYAGVSGNSSTPIGDGGPATSAYLGVTQSVTLDGGGNLYIGTAQNGGHVRKVTAGGAGFVASPPSLSFSYTIGGSNSATQNLGITSSGAALTYTASVSTSLGNWLSVTPTTGSTPATLTVSVNPSGLSGGVTYPGTITLTPGGSDNSPLVVQVSLAVAGAGAPSISSGGIRNASGYQNTLAPDTVFVIFGNNLGPAALVLGAAPNYLTNLGGTSVTFTPVAGGAPISAGMVYTLNTQVAGVLPSSIAPGTYAVSVTYNGQASASQNVTVLSRSFGIAAANGGGTGLAQATIGNVNRGLSLTRFTAGSVVFGGYDWILSPAHPGDAVVLWGTGGGADPANDTGGTSGDQTAAGNFMVTVDGISVTPAYAGASSGYPGLWQINFTIPATMAPDCYATVQVSAGGALSNVVNIPVAAAALTTCVDPNTPPAVFSKLDAGGNIVLAAFSVAKLSESAGVPQETASGSVQSRTPTEWLTLESGPVFGACRMYDRTYPRGGVDPGAPSAFLDAGAALQLTGPNLAAGKLGTITTATGPAYEGSLASGTLTAGTYTLSGSGGMQMGEFNVSTAFPGAFLLTNPAITTIDRSQPLTLSWSGSSFDHVQIVVTSSVTGAGSQHITTLSCTVPGAAEGYTIPAAALSLLLPSSSGTLAVEATNSSDFTANLAAGGQIDLGTFSANLGVSQTVPMQ